MPLPIKIQFSDQLRYLDYFNPLIRHFLTNSNSFHTQRVTSGSKFIQIAKKLFSLFHFAINLLIFRSFYADVSNIGQQISSKMTWSGWLVVGNEISEMHWSIILGNITSSANISSSAKSLQKVNVSTVKHAIFEGTWKSIDWLRCNCFHVSPCVCEIIKLSMHAFAAPRSNSIDRAVNVGERQKRGKWASVVPQNESMFPCAGCCRISEIITFGRQ